MGDPLRAMLRVAREHLTDDGFRVGEHAMLEVPGARRAIG